ncbi:MarR family transcriptional regulator [Candidatus Woesearchaeota archaeon]|nr:MarR family transcriptional regulator [Candidatus Woesearchaeota archaeon]
MLQTLENISGPKWLILQQIQKGFDTPKQIAEKLGVSIGNISQQLKLLEALGYLKKQRIDKGPGGRKKQDKRIAYSIIKNQQILIDVSQNRVSTKTIKDTPTMSLIINLIQNDLYAESEIILKLYLELIEDFEQIEGIYYMETKKDETHILVISEEISKYRHQSSKIVKIKGEDHKIVFWSHTPKEFYDGIKNKEEYFLNQKKKAVLLLGQELDIVLGGQNE